jgi:hypothetical protein
MPGSSFWRLGLAAARTALSRIQYTVAYQIHLNRGGPYMESIIYDSAASVRQLLRKGFEMPIHFAAVGANGSVVAGTFRSSRSRENFDCRITVQPSALESLTAPINIMYVDRRGEAALVVLRPLQGEPPQPEPVAEHDTPAPP